jgi:hypothetical protein
MRVLLVAGVTIFSFLGGCNSTTYGPVSGYGYKPNSLATKEMIVADMLACRIEAANKIPTNTQITTIPGTRVPITCTDYWGCSGGGTTGAKTTSFDANASLRTDVYNQCISSKGYKTNTSAIPVCRPEQIPVSYVSSLTKLYSPVPGSCFIFGGVAYSGNVILRPQDQIVPNK